MALVSGLNRPTIRERAAPLLRWGMLFGLCSILMGQCSSLKEMSQQISNLERQPVSVSVGKNSFTEISEPLTAEENASEFLREVLPLLQTFSNKLPKEMVPQCVNKPGCKEGHDQGVKVNGIEVPTLVGIASNAVTPASRKQTLAVLINNSQVIAGRPVKWKNGESLVYQIFSITPKEDLTFLVEGGYYHYSAKGEPIAAFAHDAMIRLRIILPPKQDSNVISVQKAIAIALNRGYLIEMMEVIR